MFSKLKSLLMVITLTGLLTVVLMLTSAENARASVSANSGTVCYPGAYVSSRDGHHFVAFNTKFPGHANWAITKKPWQVQVAEKVTGKKMNVWGPADRIGEVRAGFPWVDRMPWHYFFTPWDGFTLCKR